MQDIVFFCFSIQSRENHLRGSYRTANNYSNCALALSVTAIMSGLIGFIVGMGFALTILFHPCEFGPLDSALSKFVTYTLAACMLQHKLFEYSLFSFSHLQHLGSSNLVNSCISIFIMHVYAVCSVL